MPYSISSKRLSVPWFEELVAKTIDMYLRGEDLSNSPLTQAGRIATRKDKWHWSFFECKTEKEREINFRRREQALIMLYHSMKEKGYDGSLIAAWFDKDGYIHLYDGFHRMGIMKYLGIEADVNVETIWWCKDFDFPLRKVLRELPRVGQCTYEPVDDERVADFPVDRADSPQRLQYILDKMVGGTVLDIGCSEGYFARELAKRGYEITAMDKDRGKAAVTRYLATINNLDLSVHWGVGEDLLKEPVDNILYFSVFHNTIWDYGTALAFHRLRKLRGKAKRLFFEVPDGPREWQWKDRSAGPPLYHFQGRVFEKLIEEALDMRVIDRYQGFRPLYLLAANDVKTPPSFKRVSDREWKEHNRWERDWWGNCANTFGEQLLQEMYMGLMRLDQFAGPKHSLNLQGRSILDIGGGPVSILLRCENFSRAVVVDPCNFPQWVKDRYNLAHIELIQKPAEDVDLAAPLFDEAWIYNCLQHVRDPAKIIDLAKRTARKIRVYEPIEVGIHQGHPHNLSKDKLDACFERDGLVKEYGGRPGEIYYYGVFNYE